MQPDRNQNEWQQPSAQPPQSPYAAPPAEVPTQPVVAPVVTLAPEPTVVVSTPQPVAPQVSEVVPSEQLQKEASQPAASVPEMEPIRWQANEYIHHEKNTMWFVVFAVAVLVLMAIAIFLMQSITFAILVPVMAAALLVYTHRPPRVLEYTLSRQGIHVNDHLYSFGEFKSFGVIRDGEEYSVMLIPTKRFKQGVTIYFPEESGEAIVDMLGARLPMQELHLDIVDKIIRKLRI
jgi:hypothetical protein